MVKKTLIALFILTLLFIASCNTAPKQSNLKIFKYNQASCRSADPADAGSQGVIWVVNQVFNGLVQMDDRMNIKPCLAKYWMLDETGTKYTFYLRTDVYFHDHTSFESGVGRKMTAHDFVYSFNRIIDPKTSSVGAWVFNGKVKEENPFVAVNDSVLEINLRQSFPPFLGMLSMQYCSVVPREVVEFYGKDFAKHPIGTGPFRFKKWDEGKKMYLVRNTKYWEKYGNDTLPYLDAVKITFIQDKHTELMAFLRGDLDFLTSIDASIKDELLTIKGDLRPEFSNDFVFNKLPYLNTEYLGFMIDSTKEFDVNGKSLKGHPVFNKKVRQAIAHALDKDEIVRYLRNSIGTPAHKGFIPPVMFGDMPYNWQGYKYNPNKALDLLAKAGYPNGKGLPAIDLFVEHGAQDICTAILGQLKKIGININLVPTNKSFIKAEREKSSLICFYGQWIMDYPDPETFLTCYYGLNPSSPNFTRYQNEAFDLMYESSIKTLDNEKRMKLYMQSDSIAMKDAALIPIYYDQIVNFTHKYVQGLSVTPSKLLSLKYVDIVSPDQDDEANQN